MQTLPGKAGRGRCQVYTPWAQASRMRPCLSLSLSMIVLRVSRSCLYVSEIKFCISWQAATGFYVLLVLSLCPEEKIYTSWQVATGFKTFNTTPPRPVKSHSRFLFPLGAPFGSPAGLSLFPIGPLKDKIMTWIAVGHVFASVPF